ncbi:MAG TPA: class I SAM-dependent methyltransferase [Terriglobales bacterium]|nr:class I SAM-dependent methyltransferase [Terriglobales bacterium]
MNRPLYDQLVKYYEVLEGRDWKTEVDLVEFILQGHKCQSVVDLGCGTGFHVRALRKRGIRATGIDISEENIAYARKIARQNRIPSSTFVVASYYNYRPRKQFDAAICLNWSVPIRDDEILRFLSNTYVLLRPGGILIFDYERTSQIVRSDVGQAIVESWRLKGEVAVRVSVGQLKSSVLFSRDVYLFFPASSNWETPNEKTRYNLSKCPQDVKVYRDVSCVRFFSISEIRKIAAKSGFRLISNFALPRKKYVRSYAVLEKC